MIIGDKKKTQIFSRSLKGNPIGFQPSRSSGGGGGTIVPADGLYPYDLITFFPDIPVADEVLWEVVADRVLHFPTQLVGSRTEARVAPAADVALAVQKNGVQVGEITFAAGATVGAFTYYAAFDLAAGDNLALVAPHVPDATLAGISVTLCGTRPSAGESGTIPGQVGEQGDPGVVWCGPWDAATDYVLRDGVTYAGCSYVALAPSTDVAPDSNPGSWLLIAQKGDQGDAGPSGVGLQIDTVAAGAVTISAGVYATADGVAMGDCTDDAKSRIVGVARASVLDTAGITIASDGRLAGVLSGATPGDPYFLGSAGLPVVYDDVPARTRIVQLGVADANGEDLIIQIRDIGRRA